jgi:uncharacterized protein involved in response to NO
VADGGDGGGRRRRRRAGARTADARRVRLDPADEPLPAWGTASIGAATVARVAAAPAPALRVELLLVSAACWTAAFIALVWLMTGCLLAPSPRRHRDDGP